MPSEEDGTLCLPPHGISLLSGGKSGNRLETSVLICCDQVVRQCKSSSLDKEVRMPSVAS